ncbi:trans-sialidase [Trypanosoma cruzi Dm28c]|uniref:Trans-sialidase n=1 Tax=Trypanosoma cruzi Dm28c TaxID=1416333 RepID=V5AE86_TRYCR|nr:trans-sialidase [Trypanosoma cruzi Dm28c]
MRAGAILCSPVFFFVCFYIFYFIAVCLPVFFNCFACFFCLLAVGRCVFLALSLISTAPWCVLLLVGCCRLFLCGGCAWCSGRVSLSCLPLCVDGELVCAEGYTQVTGVMAMMMTGRVLLVCALCVLWCGAGGGGCSDEVVEDVVEQPVNSESGGVVTHNSTGLAVPGVAGKPSAEQTQLNNVEGFASREVSLEAALQPVSTTQQTPSSSEHTVRLTNSQSSGEERQDGAPDGTPGKPGISPSQVDNKKLSNGNKQRIDPPSPSGKDNVVSRNSEEHREDTPSSTEIIVATPSEEGHERENDTPSLGQPEGNFHSRTGHYHANKFHDDT